jgi:hypothetical protein
MNWVELKSVLSVACGLGIFAVLSTLLGWAMASAEDHPAARQAGRIVVVTIAVQAILFVALLVCASQVPQ